MKKILSLSLIGIIIDQIIKLIIVSNIEYAKSINIIKNFFRITYVRNTGGAFSILSNNTLFLSIISIVVLFIILYVIKKEKDLKKFNILIYSLLISGIVGNLIDRIRLGYVIDFLDFNFGSYQFAIFNVADIFIVVSCMLMILKIVKEGE